MYLYHHRSTGENPSLSEAVEYAETVDTLNDATYELELQIEDTFADDIQKLDEIKRVAFDAWNILAEALATAKETGSYKPRTWAQFCRDEAGYGPAFVNENIRELSARQSVERQPA